MIMRSGETGAIGRYFRNGSIESRYLLPEIPFVSRIEILGVFFTRTGNNFARTRFAQRELSKRIAWIRENGKESNRDALDDELGQPRIFARGFPECGPSGLFSSPTKWHLKVSL